MLDVGMGRREEGFVCPRSSDSPAVLLIEDILKLPDGLPQFLLLCSGRPQLLQQLGPVELWDRGGQEGESVSKRQISLKQNPRQQQIERPRRCVCVGSLI